MLIEQIFEFGMEGAWAPWPYMLVLYTNGYFHDMTKQKSLRNIVEWMILSFTAKI